jgi:hypothetical protein
VQELTRLLDLVIRELKADDARVELGGRVSEDPRVVSHELRPGARLVAVLAAPPPDIAAAQARLQRVAESFAGTMDEAIAEGSSDLGGAVAGAKRGTDRRDLADALEILRARAEATAVVIIDETSPEIWGADPPLPWDRVQDAIGAAPKGSPDEPSTIAARGIARVRREPDRLEHAAAPDRPAVVAPRILGIYRLVLAFAAPPRSPLRVTGAVRRALPVLERLLRDLPPRQPPPTEARVVPIRSGD